MRISEEAKVIANGLQGKQMGDQEVEVKIQMLLDVGFSRAQVAAMLSIFFSQQPGRS